MIKFIRHLLIPHIGNNHRSKILHNSSLFILILALLLSSTISIFINRTNPQILGVSYSMTNQELLELVNDEREKEGKDPLELNTKLNEAAREKAKHMFENNYWAHFAPDSTSPWEFITGSGYNYVYAGENLAKGFYEADDAVDAWMNSPKHRANILASQYKDVGFAIVEGRLQGEDTLLIVEMFGTERNRFLASSDVEDISESRESEGTSSAEANVNETAEVPLLGSQNNQSSFGSAVESTISESKPFIDGLVSAKTITFVLVSILLIALVLDFFVVTKRKIPRNVGDNLDHIFLFSIFIVFLFMYNLGYVL